MSKNQYETTLTDYPVCPHCGEKQVDAWEWNFGAGIEGDIDSIECGSCDKSMSCSRIVTVRYTTNETV